MTAGDILHFDQRHFVVFDHLEGQSLVILDPAAGRLTLDPAAFAEAFSGMALLFAATPSALQQRKQKLGL